MIDTNERQQEQERLTSVEEKLRSAIAELEPEVTGLRGQVVDIRRSFWEEVTVNTSTHEDFEETFYSIKQQEALLSERERSHHQRMQRYKGMKRLLPSPYFGRVDFEEDGLGFREAIYIGVSSFVDTDGLSFLIYDWRTPIASMYYDGSPGEAAYDTPGGRVAGMMTLKRQYQIREGRLLNVFDTSITIGDELLQQMLGKGADAQMKSIVATIQREQNAIIRNDKCRMLIVQGAAGSGKTSAALQRAAYLLYSHRDRLRADQMVLFSPNPMFNSYVSTVLPELGEENIQQTTFQEYAEHWLADDFRLESPFEQLEYVLSAPAAASVSTASKPPMEHPQTQDQAYEARLSGIRYKASEVFLRALQGYADWLGKEGMLFRDIRFQERKLIAAERIQAQFYAYDGTIRLTNRITLLREWLLRELAALERAEEAADWVQDELEYLDKDQYAEAYGTLLKKYRRDDPLFDFTQEYVEQYGDFRKVEEGEENVFDFAEQEERLLRRIVVKERFLPLRREVKRLAFVDVVGLYGKLFGDADVYRAMTGEAEAPEHWEDIGRQTKEKMGRLELFYEDAVPFLYLKELVEGTRTNTEVRHLFVDEGQDYSPFQYRFLKQLFPRARMTVLGDFGQAIFPQATNLQEADSPLIRLYGEEETNLIRLVRSYRSTREIVEFTKALLPGEEIVPFERSGDKPVLWRSADAAESLDDVGQRVGSMAQRMDDVEQRAGSMVQRMDDVGQREGSKAQRMDDAKQRAGRSERDTDGAVQRAKRIAGDLAGLRAEGFDSIAVITKTAAESREAYDALTVQGCDGLRLVTEETLTFEKGTAVIPVYLAKGVEFDAVLIYEASSEAYNRESERKLFYTACTRAMHRLLLYSTGEWTPYIRELDGSLYVGAT